MDEMVPIGRVSAAYGISSRTLRHWEDMGLIRSKRDPQSGWRVYDENMLACIRVIGLLRRMELPLREIGRVLDDRSLNTFRHVLMRQLERLAQSRRKLGRQEYAVRTVLAGTERDGPFSMAVLEEMLGSLERMDQAAELLQERQRESMGKIDETVQEVQIIRLPQMRCAAFSAVGAEPEDAASEPVLQWVREQKLEGTMRLYGFNTEPYPAPGKPEYGFSFCASVPKETEITDPLFEIQLPGGAYAALATPPGGDPSLTWRRFHELLRADSWEWVYDDSRHPGLEEHVPMAEGGYHITVLLPVKRR